MQIKETKEGLAQNKCSVKQGLSKQVRSSRSFYYLLTVWQETNQWTALKRSSRTYTVGHTQMPWTSVRVHPPPPATSQFTGSLFEPTPKERSLEASGGSQEWTSLEKIGRAHV